VNDPIQLDQPIHESSPANLISPVSRTNSLVTKISTSKRDLREYISATSEHADIRAGSPLPLGTQESGGGVNFAIFTRNATRVRLNLFKNPEDGTPDRFVDLDPARNRTGDVWHVWVKDISSGQLYAYRVDGPYEPDKGHRFNFKRLLLDPLAAAISQQPQWDFALARGYDASSSLQDLAISKQDNAKSMPKCIFVNGRSATPTPLGENRHL